MKELSQMWTKVTGRRYSAVNTNDRELRELAHNRVQRADIDVANCEGNNSECEGLNGFGNDLNFSERKTAILNRLFEKRRQGSVARHPKSLFLYLMLGFFSVGIGVFILVLHPYEFLFNANIVMSDGGEVFEIWRQPEVELYCKIYLFNITNADKYMSGIDDKLKIVEVGPYVYRERLEHTKVRFNDNGTLSTVPVHPLEWVEELSAGNREDDLLYLPNIALLSIANVAAKGNPFTRFGLNNIIKYTKSQPIVQMTAREFMMGYESKLLTLGNSFLPGWIYFDKLGLIDRMYDFEGDYETIFTGETDVRLSGLIDTYKGSTDLPHWTGKHCSNVQTASDGTKFKGGLTRNETVLFYRKSLCRAANLVPVQEGARSGLKAYMYTFEENLMDNGKYNQDNKCYCRKGRCFPVGIIDVTDCYYGFPITLSYPHFYKGDEVLSSKVEGMTPSKELHETRIWIQPESGLPLDVSTKFQINMALDDISSIANSHRFSNMYLPMLWFDITMSKLPPSLESKFKVYLNVLPLVVKACTYISFIVGLVLIVISVYRLAFSVMFKSFKNVDKGRNIIIGADNWIRSEEKCNSRDVYEPCEVPIGDDATDSDEAFSDERIHPGFLKTHGDKIKELSHKLGDRVYDSVGSVKERVLDEVVHVRHIFKDGRKDSLINAAEDCNTNEAYKSDSSEESDQSFNNETLDSDDDCRYLEVVDDGSEFDGPNDAAYRMNRLDSAQSQREKACAGRKESILDMSD